MLKRAVYVILVLLILISLCACGTATAEKGNKESEQFELRSGIHFGDTIEEVKKKETTLTYVTDDTELGYVAFKGTIAGFDDSYAYFYYDDNNRVIEVEYSFSNVGEPDTAKKVYETIYNSCVRQYGEPLSRGTEYPVAGRAVSSAYNQIDNANRGGGNGELLGYNQWAILGDDENNTKIDLVYYTTAYYFKNLGTVGLPTYSVKISYTPFQQAMINDIDSEF